MSDVTDQMIIEQMQREIDALESKLAGLKPKAAAYDAMCDVGLIQFDPSIPDHVYSVWGFTCWHHDKDILKAIAAANEPVKLAAIKGDKPCVT